MSNGFPNRRKYTLKRGCNYLRVHRHGGTEYLVIKRTLLLNVICLSLSGEIRTAYPMIPRIFHAKTPVGPQTKLIRAFLIAENDVVQFALYKFEQRALQTAKNQRLSTTFTHPYPGNPIKAFRNHGKLCNERIDGHDP